MPKVVHLIPYDGIGGVETAARSMAGYSTEDIEFQVDYIYPPATSQRGRYDTFNPLPILRAVRRILAGKPDFIIVSLWRSGVVTLLLKLLCPRLQVVLFLHATSDAHWLDRFVTRHVAAHADQIWADSQETLDQRLSSIPANRGRVISFVTSRISPVPLKPVSPVFIYWGRVHPRKGLDRALGIYSAVHDADNTARFFIIGPDGGDLERIKSLAKTLCLEDSIKFLGGMDFGAISELARSASFFLQTSSMEGMGMSVVEGMQLGLVPVVTPVGEIGNYCKGGENALVVHNDDVSVDEIVSLLNDNPKYQTLRKNAIATWAQMPLYSESILQACREFPLNNSDNW